MTRPRITEDQKCICSRPKPSGRVNVGYHVCMYCGLLIVTLKRRVS